MSVELAAVESVKPGDSITVARSTVTIAETNEYDDDTVVLVYFKQGGESYENKARDSSGRNRHSILILQSIVPMKKGDTIAVERGNPAYAAKLRREMEDAEKARAQAAVERWHRAGLADEARQERGHDHVDPPRDPEAEPRSFMCLCGHLVSGHVLYRDQTAPGGTYHYGRCLHDGCTCTGAQNETGTIKERR